MLERQRAEIERLSASQVRKLADTLERDVAQRGFLVRFAAAGTIRELRQIANRKASGGSDA